MIRVVYNGRIYLGRESFCEALLIDGGRIVRTGSSADLLDAAPAFAEKIDAEGALLLPAFHDSHLHLMWTGRRAGGIEGAGAKSIEEVIQRGRDHIARTKAPAGTYVQGAGINPDLFTAGEKRDLRREDLDRISTEHPIILSRHCGHTIYCNSPALALAGLGESAPEVEGGTIEKDANGRPTGVSRENANALIRRPVPAPSQKDMKGFLLLAMEKARSLGISACGSYDSGGTDFESVLEVYRDICEEARREGKPVLRVTMQCGVSGSGETLDALLERKIPTGAPLWDHGQWGVLLRMGPVKLFADGTLGGQTAWMRQPYRDKPETRGFPAIDPETLKLFVRKAASHDMQTVIHAIGDAGLDAAISAIEQVTGPGKNAKEANTLRHGIIHCQISTPDLLERMARNRILALVQPVFLADDISIVEHRVGPELASTSYAWGSMQTLGIPVSYGTDAPVSGLDPLRCIEWAVLRRDSENPDHRVKSFYPDERVDICSAVDAYTAASAYSVFAEKSLGRVAPGFLADLVFLDRDIFAAAPEEIHKAKVLRTMCAGETVYQA